MAFETDCEQDRPPQKARIRRTMREVAGFATVDTNRGVLKQEWASLIGVALETRFLIGQGLIDHARARGHAPGRRRRSVRIVAIRTGNDAFVHPMLGGHVELRSYRGVTVVAEIGLFFGEQRFGAD